MKVYGNAAAGGPACHNGPDLTTPASRAGLVFPPMPEPRTGVPGESESQNMSRRRAEVKAGRDLLSLMGLKTSKPVVQWARANGYAMPSGTVFPALFVVQAYARAHGYNVTEDAS